MGKNAERKKPIELIILPGLQGYAGAIARHQTVLVPALDNAKRGFLAVYEAKGNLHPAERVRKEIELEEAINEIVEDLNTRGKINAAKHKAIAFIKRASDCYKKAFGYKSAAQNENTEAVIFETMKELVKA